MAILYLREGAYMAKGGGGKRQHGQTPTLWPKEGWPSPPKGGAHLRPSQTYGGPTWPNPHPMAKSTPSLAITRLKSGVRRPMAKGAHGQKHGGRELWPCDGQKRKGAPSLAIAWPKRAAPYMAKGEGVREFFFRTYPHYHFGVGGAYF